MSGESIFISHTAKRDLKGMSNFVGLLQEKCQVHQRNLPTYSDVETNESNPVIKRCLCKLDNWTAEGSGFNKKLARQNAAEQMLRLVESEGWIITTKKPSSVNAAMKINLFCDKSGKEKPLCIEKDKVNDLFVIEYTLDGYTAVGRGRNKKTAMEIALEDLANHFEVDVFYNNFLKQKERIQQRKNSIEKLQELCQARKLPNPVFWEEVVKGGLGRTQNFVISCSLNGLETHSEPNCSKKNAKIEAATLMLEKLTL